MESRSLIEPVMPPPGNRLLENKASDLIAATAALNQAVLPAIRQELGKVVRSMNCYYSNLIEGHRTLPRDIEKALNNNFVDDERTKNLQQEAIAHIKVQEKIDLDLAPGKVASAERICWLHREFIDNLPQQMRKITNNEQTLTIDLIGGNYRNGDVIVGKHIPIKAGSIPLFLDRFSSAYNPDKLSKIRGVIAAGASHHRLLWIHPFYDGNGRVSRLFSHGYLREVGIGNSLWSVARGLSRNIEEYKKLLALADSPRWNDLDGRGNLTTKGLVEFCDFFLSICCDQVAFMSSLIEPQRVLNRIELYIQEKVKEGLLLPNSFLLVRQIWLEGEIPKSRVPEIVGYKERQARNLQKKLLDLDIIKSSSIRSPLKLSLTVESVERYFPNLF